MAKLQTDTKLSELAQTIRLYDQGRQEPSSELVLSGIGIKRMDEIRILVAKLCRGVSVRDDGVDSGTTVPPASAHGLLGMRYRVKA